MAHRRTTTAATALESNHPGEPGHTDDVEMITADRTYPALHQPPLGGHDLDALGVHLQYPELGPERAH